MHRTGVWSRVLSGALAAWFGVVMAAPAVLHSCPRAVAAAAAAGAESHDHAGHGSHGAGDQDRAPSSQCQCLGSCAVSSPALLASGTPRLVAALEPMHLGGPGPARAAARVTHPDHLRPFATAPPPSLG
ncbi:MAG TPA: hypothetical protein VFV65_07595 [Gemmatimonadales bacterium]|nr:hypothetical protein [Gemmatimonadales bacterium]